jgi:hypothetical protein
MIGTEQLILPNHGSAWQYMHETVWTSCRDHLASSMLQKYVDLHRRYDRTMDIHKLNTITENIKKKQAVELTLKQSNITTHWKYKKYCTVWDRALQPWKECRKCDVGGGKEKEIYLLFRMKVLTKFSFAVFAKSTWWFPLVFVRYYQMGIQFTKGRFCPCHRAQAVSRRLLTTEAASIKYFQGG